MPQKHAINDFYNDFEILNAFKKPQIYVIIEKFSLFFICYTALKMCDIGFGIGYRRLRGVAKSEIYGIMV